MKPSHHLLIALTLLLGIQQTLSTSPAWADLSTQITEKRKPPICINPNKPCRDGSPPRSPLEINFISPSRGNLSINENRPFLAWVAVPKATYNIRIKRATETLWEVETKQSELIYPSDQTPLEPAQTYTIIVEAIPESTAANSKPIRGQITFRTLDLANNQRIQSETQKILENSQLTEDQRNLKLAELYIKPENNLLTEALNVLNRSVKNGSRNPLIYQMKGELLLITGDFRQAVNTYKEALELATFLQDPYEQATAQIGLAKAYTQLQQWEQAITYLQAARAYYQKSNELDLSSKVAQFIGEVYEDSGDLQQAINWYKQAEIEYQKLGDQLRVNAMKRKISALN